MRISCQYAQYNISYLASDTIRTPHHICYMYLEYTLNSCNYFYTDHVCFILHLLYDSCYKQTCKHHHIEAFR